MDVVLKKEYQIGFMGNVEGGYGTHDRFAGRLFGLLFTPDSRLIYQYDYRRCRSDREYYSRMWGDGEDTESAQERLPSELEAAWRLDAGNTFYSTLETQCHTIAPEWWQSLARGRDGWHKRLFIRPTMVYVSSRLDYLRNGLTLRYANLPYGWSVSTDIAMHSRRGYVDSRLNDNHPVWNARVSKSILKGKLTFILDGFDILGQLSNVTYEINAQGRTESRYNTLPRYALFNVIYRLNIQPKKH